jgi:pimeloyl-ACP methyl ester carboxylesterase
VALEPELFGVAVPGGGLRVARWGDGPVVLAAHGITANHRCWTPLVRALDGAVTLVAPDLRGRGGSAGLGGPYGMSRHAGDLVAVLDHLGVAEAVVIGHSMGGFVAGAMAAEFPDRVTAMVLVDGGLPLPVPAGLDVDEVLLAVIGPAMERLQRTFASRQEYEDFWRTHPAFGGPGAFNDDVVAYVQYDLEGDEPELRSRTSIDAVRGDSADTLVPDLVAERFARTRCPVTFLGAERGMFDQPEGLFPEELVDAARRIRPEMTTETVAGTNHYTIVMSDAGAAVIADRLQRMLSLRALG